MKIKEDHIIAALILMIIIVIWSKFTRTSSYPPGQAGSFAAQPSILSVGNDITIANWTGGANPPLNNNGFAFKAATPDWKLQPGDLNRQGWAGVSGGAGSTKFVGFRKQLQPGGGGPVWYLYSATGDYPSATSFKQDQVSDILVKTSGGFNIPVFVLFKKSAVSPFVDGGCTYSVAPTGGCSVTDCAAGTGTQIQILTLVSAASGTANCYAPDGVTMLDTATATSNVGNINYAGSNTATIQATTSLKAPGAGSSQNTPNGSLASAGIFTTTAATGSTMYYASPCVPAGCAGVASGFLQNSGTVVTIAGTGSANGLAMADSSNVVGQDGIGTAGSVNANKPAAAFVSPAFIACSGTLSATSNIIVANVVTAASSYITLRSMFLNTSDTPNRWEAKTLSLAHGGGSGVTAAITGIAMDLVAAPNGNVYVAENGNNNIHRITYSGSGSRITNWWSTNNIKGIWLDATTSNPAGSNLYAIQGNELWILPSLVSGVSAGVVNQANGPWKITGLPNTPNQLTVSGAGTTSATCYYTGGSTITKFTIPTIPGGFSSGSNTAVIAFTTWTPTNPSISGNGQLIVDKNGTLYMANGPSNTIVKIDSAGNSQTFVGGGAGTTAATPGTIVDSGANSANAAQPGGGALFNAATGLALSSDTLTMYVADTGDFLIRQIT